MEIIIEIKDFVDEDGDYEGAILGFEIVTSLQSIYFLMSSTTKRGLTGWGYLLDHSSPSYFVGAIVKDVYITCRAHKPDLFIDKGLRELLDPGFVGNVLFADLETDRGILQYVAYNVYGGYHNHEARVLSKQCRYIEIL